MKEQLLFTIYTMAENADAIIYKGKVSIYIHLIQMLHNKKNFMRNKKINIRTIHIKKENNL